jgi:hypothetical protein
MAFFTNWSAPMPWYRKIRLAFRNTWIKISQRRDCCGHLGEPGC